MNFDLFDHAPLPTAVTRAGRLVYVNASLARTLGVSRDQALNLSLADAAAPEQFERLRERQALRLRGEAVPNNYEVELLLPDGTRRTLQLWVSAAGEYVVYQAIDRSADENHRRHLTALATLGAKVQGGHGPCAILATTSRGLEALGATVAWLALPGTTARPVVGGPELAATKDAPELTQAVREGSSYSADLAHVLRQSVTTPFAALPTQPTPGIVLRVDAQGEPGCLLAVLGGWLLPEDQPAFHLFAAQVSAALDAAKSIEDLSRKNAALAALNRIATLAGTHGSAELLTTGCEALAQVTSCDAVAVYLIDQKTRVANLTHQRGGSKEIGERLRRIPLAGTNLGVVAQEGRPRVWHRDDYPPERRAMLDQMGQRVVVSVPLVVHAKTIGVMNLAFVTDRTVSPDEVDFLQAAGAHFASAIQTEALVEDLRHSYADLARTQEQLVQRERLAALGELSSVVAHEVRNPLGAIFNALQSLKHLELGHTEADALLSIMSEEATRLNQLVGDLLDFARPMMLQLDPGRVEAVLADAVEAALGEARSRIEVRHELAEGLPAVPMDARLLRQAFLNLAINAVQAMPAKGTLTLGLRVEVHGGGHAVRVDVTDTGPGMAPEVAKRIFEPFFTTKATGTGLGLAVVRRIVSEHRGQLSVRSAPGEGATFSVLLPVPNEGR